MLKKQERLERQQANKKGNTLAAQQTRPSWRPASSSSQVPIQDHQREMARARRFGNGSALGATRAPAYQVSVLEDILVKQKIKLVVL